MLHKRMAIPNPIVGHDKGILWNNLPYCGVYTESQYAGESFKDITMPTNHKVMLVGAPLPLINNGVNKNLRLIGFARDGGNGPIVVQSLGQLISFSPWLDYKVNWNTSKPCTIGFYTSNYLLGLTSSLMKHRTLLISKHGPCIFSNASCGKFYASEFNEIYVVVDADVTVTLNVATRPLCRVIFPQLQLYKPVIYTTKCGCEYASETKVSTIDQQVAFAPTLDYIDIMTIMRKYILDTSVILDFSQPITRALIMQEDPLLELRFERTTKNAITDDFNNTVGVVFQLVFPYRPQSLIYPTIPGPDNLPRGIHIIPSVDSKDPSSVKVSCELTLTSDVPLNNATGSVVLGTTSSGNINVYTEAKYELPLQLDTRFSIDASFLRSFDSFEWYFKVIFQVGTVLDQTLALSVDRMLITYVR